MKFNVEEFIGKKFNHLTIVEDLGVVNHTTYVRCLCDCGQTKDARLMDVKAGRIKSCGHLKWSAMGQKRSRPSRERLRGVWSTMKARCFNPKDPEYFRYGALGIVVCDEWKYSYSSFREWAYSHGYDPDAPRGECTLDRIDSCGNYEPSNCRWVSMKIQSNNTKRNHYLEYNGVTHTVHEWSEITGVNYQTLLSRIQNGDSPDRLFRPPDRVQRNSKISQTVS